MKQKKSKVFSEEGYKKYPHHLENLENEREFLRNSYEINRRYILNPNPLAVFFKIIFISIGFWVYLSSILTQDYLGFFGGLILIAMGFLINNEQ